ncbi:winged helix-turn-helix domain-containing protein, partial [Spirosoma aerophilum]
LRSSKPLVWLHLGKMKTNGLITCRSEGNRHLYSLPDNPFINQLLFRLDNFVQPLIQGTSWPGRSFHGC